MNRQSDESLRWSFRERQTTSKLNEFRRNSGTPRSLGADFVPASQRVEVVDGAYTDSGAYVGTPNALQTIFGTVVDELAADVAGVLVTITRVIDGAMAEGGGDFTVVSDFEFEFVVLLEVDSVTIACANTETVAVIIKIAANFFNIFFIFPL